MTTRRRWVPWVVIAVGLVVLALALFRACAPAPVLRVIAVGDMACTPVDPAFNDGAGRDDECVAQSVSDAAVARTPDLFLGLGDYQYEVASEADWAAAYAPSWGRLREITRPALGNQELKVHKASSYYAFFDDVAIEQPGYTSYDVGDWHVVVLNTNCTVVEGGCGVESPQVAWLKEDLAANAGRCILAYGHHPRWSNGIGGPDNRIDPLWSALVDGGATMYLSGHEANYERFPPLDTAHRPDPAGRAAVRGRHRGPVALRAAGGGCRLARDLRPRPVRLLRHRQPRLPRARARQRRVRLAVRHVGRGCHRYRIGVLQPRARRMIHDPRRSWIGSST